MIKHVLGFLLVTTLTLSAASAPTNVVKITELPASSTPVTTNDLLPLVQDVGTTPITVKATVWQLGTAIIGASNYLLSVINIASNIAGQVVTNNLRVVSGTTNLVFTTNIVGNVTTITISINTNFGGSQGDFILRLTGNGTNTTFNSQTNVGDVWFTGANHVGLRLNQLAPSDIGASTSGKTGGELWFDSTTFHLSYFNGTDSFREPLERTGDFMIGDLFFTPNNTFDIGDSVNRPKDVWVGNQLIANGLVIEGGTIGAGKVLTDLAGNGIASWQTPSGGGGGSATNAVTVLQTNGVIFINPVTVINFTSGPNTTISGSANGTTGNVFVTASTKIQTNGVNILANAAAINFTNGAGITLVGTVNGTTGNVQIVNSNPTNYIVTAGTNTVVTSNVSGTTITYVINTATNSGGGGTGTESVWTNDVGIVHFKSTSGKLTNDFQIHTNGGVSLGKGTIPFWTVYSGTEVGAGGESLVSVRDTALGELDFNELFFGIVDLVTNDCYFDMFATATLVSRQITLESGAFNANIRDYVDNDGETVFEAFNESGQIWKFRPIGPNNAAYSFDTIPRVVQPEYPLVEYANNGTNKFIVWGDGKINIAGQITNQFLQTNKFVMTDSGKGLISASIGEDDLLLFATTNYVNCAVTSHVATLTGTTNFINLSVQAAKLPGNDNPAVGSGYKNWELVYYKTNASGSVAALSANWQFVVPFDYATNSMSLYVQQMILQTNGPATSNTIFAAEIFKSTPGDSKDIHTNLIFSVPIYVTNTWSASTSGTNILQTSTFSFGTNTPLQSGDFAVLRLTRGATNDTYLWEVGIVGMQLFYTRK